jgi:hypothetical protein
MSATPKERAEVIARLVKLGISYQDAEALRRISNTLHNWFELECGTGNDRVSRSIERDENGDGKPFLRVRYIGYNNQWIDRKSPIADREAGAKRRLAAIMANYRRRLVPYIQGDCRGASLYVLRKADVRGQDINSIYNRGVAVF